MFEPDQYELVDFGAGRKLERFGAELLDRPSPAAYDTTMADPGLWGRVTARFEPGKGGKGHWHETEFRSAAKARDDSPSVRHGDSRLVLQLSPSGNVGLFPEQASNWDWIAEQVGHCVAGVPARRPRVLNLFAYTGAASLAAAAAGAEVAHVDSSGPAVAWAKRNAEVSGMAGLPIRWLVDDAMKFVARECRRGNFYDGVIADPPTYGHGPKGRPFKFKRDLDELMEACGQLLRSPDAGGGFLLFSCHAPGFDRDDAVLTVTEALGAVYRADLAHAHGSPLVLQSRDGRELAAGVSARWSANLTESR